MKELTQSERDELLAKYAAIRDRLRTGYELSVDQRKALVAEGDKILDEYINGLPKIPIGGCPFNGEMTVKGMDVFGLDGKWWYKNCPDIQAIGCPHYITFLGALNLNGNPPEGCSTRAIDEIQPGPDAPFVVPRLLNLDGISCTISSRKMVDDKFTAYFMAYYSQKPIGAHQSHQQWLHASIAFTGKAGQPNWHSATDVWDFDLDAWRKKPGKIFWSAPDDPTVALHPGTDSAFPYANLPGKRLPQVIRQGRVAYLPLPDGSPIEPGD